MKLLKFTILVLLHLVCLKANAYSVDQKEEACRKPQFLEFNLPIYSEDNKTEVKPQSEVIFKLSPWTNPESVIISIRDQPVSYSIESNSSFHRVKFALPEQYKSTVLRINANASAMLGCGEKTGWLIKISE